jgi:hypothetical protein
MVGVKCPRCAYALTLKDLKQAQSQVGLTCPQCQHIFLKISQSDSPNLTSIDKSSYTASKRIHIKFEGPELLISSRWFSSASWPLLIFTILWNGLIGFSVWMIYVIQAEPVTDMAPLFVLALFTLIGLAMLVFSLRELINSSYFKWRFGEISFWAAPLSFKGKKTLQISEIKDITIKRADGGRVNNRKVYVHYVCAFMKNGENYPLIRVRDMNEAIYLEKYLEEKLSLKDDPSLDRIDG